MYKTLFGILILLCISFTVSAQTSNVDLSGTWKAWDYNLLMHKDVHGFQGYFVDEYGKQTQAEKVVHDLVYAEKGVWKGKLYSKKRNKTSEIECRLLSHDELEVKIIIARFFSKTFNWKKLKE